MCRRGQTKGHDHSATQFEPFHDAESPSLGIHIVGRLNRRARGRQTMFRRHRPDPGSAGAGCPRRASRFSEITRPRSHAFRRQNVSHHAKVTHQAAFVWHGFPTHAVVPVDTRGRSFTLGLRRTGPIYRRHSDDRLRRTNQQFAKRLRQTKGRFFRRFRRRKMDATLTSHPRPQALKRRHDGENARR
jgi:hypothetical protein